MPSLYKGIKELYDEACKLFNVDSFYEWIDSPRTDLVPGQICYTVIHFHREKRWVLQEANYDPFDESKSTWYAKEYRTRLPTITYDNGVKKYFGLRKDEHLIVQYAKHRPIILLKKIATDWYFPGDPEKEFCHWLCFPLFSYQDRHSQDFVLNDQRLSVPHRFYMPRYYSDKPGLRKESAVLLSTIQTIPLGNIKPHFQPSSNHSGHPTKYKLSSLALKLINYHFLRCKGILSDIKESGTQYDEFKYVVNEYMNEALK